MTLEDLSIMRFRPITLVRALLLLSLVSFLLALPARSQPIATLNTPESSAVSGKVAGLSETQLTLSIGREHTLNTLAFVIDSNTKIEGALMVGAHATVDYRTEGEHLIATHIVATPSSGVASY
jgi:hypothetical protein